MPQTWRGTYEGNREYVTQLRRTAEQRRAVEEKSPGTARVTAARCSPTRAATLPPPSGPATDAVPGGYSSATMEPTRAPSAGSRLVSTAA